MSRIPLATDLKTRTGAPSTKDARQVNSYMEIKGEQAAVRKRPAAQGGITTGIGTAQGGIGLTINGTPYFIGFWSDTLYSATNATLSNGGLYGWSSTTSYVIGDFVDFIASPPLDPFASPSIVRYYAMGPNTNKSPALYPNYWATSPAPSTRYFAQGVEYVGGVNVPRIGSSCATEIAAVQSCFDLYIHTSCPGEAGNSYIWYEPPLGLTGSYPLRYGTFTQWDAAPLGNCSTPHLGGATPVAQLTQTA